MKRAPNGPSNRLRDACPRQRAPPPGRAIASQFPLRSRRRQAAHRVRAVRAIRATRAIRAIRRLPRTPPRGPATPLSRRFRLRLRHARAWPPGSPAPGSAPQSGSTSGGQIGHEPAKRRATARRPLSLAAAAVRRAPACWWSRPIRSFRRSRAAVFGSPTCCGTPASSSISISRSSRPRATTPGSARSSQRFCRSVHFLRREEAPPPALESAAARRRVLRLRAARAAGCAISPRPVDARIVQLEHTELGQFAGLFPGRAVTLTELDLSFVTAARRRALGFEKRFAVDRVLWGDESAGYRRLLRYEIRSAESCDQVHVMSAADAATLGRYLHDGRAADSGRGQRRRLRAVPGRARTGPAAAPRRALRRLFRSSPESRRDRLAAREIWPRVRAARTDARLAIVGAHPLHRSHWRPTAATASRSSARCPDTAAFYRDARVLLAPIRAGSGTRLKLLEAFASGLPVVTTRLAAEGLRSPDGEHLLTAESAPELAAATCPRPRRRSSRAPARRVGRAARRTALRLARERREADGVLERPAAGEAAPRRCRSIPAGPDAEETIVSPADYRPVTRRSRCRSSSRPSNGGERLVRAWRRSCASRSMCPSRCSASTRPRRRGARADACARRRVEPHPAGVLQSRLDARPRRAPRARPGVGFPQPGRRAGRFTLAPPDDRAAAAPGTVRRRPGWHPRAAGAGRTSSTGTPAARASTSRASRSLDRPPRRHRLLDRQCGAPPGGLGSAALRLGADPRGQEVAGAPRSSAVSRSSTFPRPPSSTRTPTTW